MRPNTKLGTEGYPERHALTKPFVKARISTASAIISQASAATVRESHF